MAALLHINDLSVSFGEAENKSPAVRGLSLQVNAGEWVALVGESGSGKSVTAMSTLRLLPAPPVHYDSGNILFSEPGKQPVDLLRLTMPDLQRLRGNRIGMIFQEPMSSLNPVMTCGEQVGEVLRLHLKLNNDKARLETIALFEKVRLPDPTVMYTRYPHQLSGGQKQRVMIAMAVSCRPALLICDEPTTALDPTVQQNILGLLRDLQHADQMGILFITHDLGVVQQVADRVAVMYQGRIVEEGSVEEIFLRPRHPYTKGLLQCRPILHNKGERLPVVSDFMDADTPNISQKNTDSFVKPIPVTIIPKTAIMSATSTPPLLRAEALEVWYPGEKNLLGKTTAWVKAVNGVSLDIFRGETLGLIGESGCGKTTLGRTLLRLIEPVSGRLFYEEEDLLAMSPSSLKKFRQKIQLVFQDPYSSLNPRMMVGPAIAEALLVHGMGRREAQERVIHLLEQVDLNSDHYHRYPHAFSGGQRQRIVIARALALNPEFVVFDESVAALDVSVQAQVLNLINDLKQEFNFTALFITHDLPVVRYISDRIVEMREGKII